MIKAPTEILAERRVIWTSKPIVRKLYQKWYGHVKEALRPGKTLELGGGSGNLKDFLPGAILSDLVFAPWLDAVMDAHALPFGDGSLDNMVLLDVLHHLAAPAVFFQEAGRVLRREGRIVMLEPYVSWLSFPVYRFLHAEGMKWHVNPFEQGSLGGKRPFQGNQALPKLIFGKFRQRFLKDFPRLKIVREEKMDALIYPLSGGFHSPSFCPLFMWSTFEKIEKMLQPLTNYTAFRILVILEKT